MPKSIAKARRASRSWYLLAVIRFLHNSRKAYGVTFEETIVLSLEIALLKGFFFVIFVLASEVFPDLTGFLLIKFAQSDCGI